MKKSIFLFFAAILCAMGVQAKTIYLKPNANWAGNSPRNAAYFFGNGDTWVSMTDDDGDGVYECEVPDGYPNVIFCSMNKNTTGLSWDDKWNQSADLTIPTDDKNLCTLANDWNSPTGTWSVYDPLSTGLYLRGTMNSWEATNEFRKETADATTASITISLDAGTDYEFKVANADWSTGYGNGAFTATATVSLASNGSNVTLKTIIEGEYTFTWEMSTSKLTVTYPPLPKYQVTATATNGTVTGTGEYEHGTTANLVATPDAGYVFVNWTKGGEQVSAEATYSFTVTEDVALVANFTAEETHDVTISYLCGTTNVKPQQTLAVGVTLASQVTATTPIDGRYAFQSWDLGSGVQSADATANPISIITLASGDYTLTANYKDTYVTVYFVNTKSWPTVNAYVWGTGDPYKAWSGEAMTLTGEKVHDYDVYSYSFPAEYTNCIFNGNGQTDNLTVEAGQYYDIASKTWYATLAEVPSPAPVVMETVYLINTGNWEKVHAHAWKDAVNNGWPGDQLTKSGEKIAEFDVYPFQAEQGQWKNIIFNCGGDECKTSDLTWQAGKYYAPSKNEWYDDAAAAESALGTPAVITYQLKGVGGWDVAGIEMTENPDKAGEYMLTCQAISATDAVKVVKLADGVITDYYGNGTVKDGVEVTVNYDGDGNITLAEGTYNFYFDTNEAEKKLWIAAATDCETEPTPDYTRTVTTGNFGTLCLPFGGEITGAVLYECVGRETGKVYLGSVTTLVAGVPYIFQATATELAVYSDGTTATEAGSSNGLHGTFDNETVVAAGNYILLNNELRPSDGTAKVNANRAYLVMSEVLSGAPQQMPGRRYIGMDVTGENEATGFENITNGENTTIKVIENGQLIIIRNGEKFNAQGIKL